MRPCGLAVILTQKLNALINKKENWVRVVLTDSKISLKNNLFIFFRNNINIIYFSAT